MVQKIPQTSHKNVSYSTQLTVYNVRTTTQLIVYNASGNLPQIQLQNYLIMMCVELTIVNLIYIALIGIHIFLCTYIVHTNPRSDIKIVTLKSAHAVAYQASVAFIPRIRQLSYSTSGITI